ncbi:MAG: hypothetical protein J2P18_08145, partial [Nocardia sp.]|nr:hypothetical protein [Nocardia sp.]
DRTCGVIGGALDGLAEVIRAAKIAVFAELAGLAVSYGTALAGAIATDGLSLALAEAAKAAARKLCSALEQMLLAEILNKVIDQAIKPLEHVIDNFVHGALFDAARDALDVPATNQLRVDPDEIDRYANVFDDLADDILGHGQRFADQAGRLTFTMPDPLSGLPPGSSAPELPESGGGPVGSPGSGSTPVPPPGVAPQPAMQPADALTTAPASTSAPGDAGATGDAPLADGPAAGHSALSAATNDGPRSDPWDVAKSAAMHGGSQTTAGTGGTPHPLGAWAGGDSIAPDSAPSGSLSGGANDPTGQHLPPADEVPATDSAPPQTNTAGVAPDGQAPLDQLPDRPLSHTPGSDFTAPDRAGPDPADADQSAADQLGTDHQQSSALPKMPSSAPNTPWRSRRSRRAGRSRAHGSRAGRSDATPSAGTGPTSGTPWGGQRPGAGVSVDGAAATPWSVAGSGRTPSGFEPADPTVGQPAVDTARQTPPSRPTVFAPDAAGPNREVRKSWITAANAEGTAESKRQQRGGEDPARPVGP